MASLTPQTVCQWPIVCNKGTTETGRNSISYFLLVYYILIQFAGKRNLIIIQAYTY